MACTAHPAGELSEIEPIVERGTGSLLRVLLTAST